MRHKNASPSNKILLIESAKKSIFEEYGYLAFAMILPVVLVYLIYLSKGLHPFGNGCVLVLDLNGQYVWFFEALRNFVRGDADLLYSFSRALGGEFLGIYAYYLASPLSFLLCLFPKERMLEGLLALFLLKTALCGGTFGYYLHRTAKQRNPFVIIAFSICYALSSYAVVQQHNTMWIDAVMWLPLITLGIEELIKHGKFKLYTLTLAVTLFSNFYIGYMVCIYCAIYFFSYYLAHAEENRNNPYGERAHFVKSFCRITLYSLLAVGIAAVILLSAYYSLNFGKTTFSSPDWGIRTNFDIIELLYKFLPGSYDTVRPEGLPFVYCGVLTLLLIPSYFLSRKYSMREKIVSGIFIFLFVASFTLNVTDLIWHGFQRPNWLNYRYSFMLCFYLCVLAARALSDFEGLSLKAVMGTGGLIALLCVILQQYTDNEYVTPNDYTCIWFTLLAVFAYLAVLGIMRTATCKQVVGVALVAVICVEVFLNGLWNLNGLDYDVTYSRYSYYNNFLKGARPIVEMVQESDDSFYRMEKTFFRKTNDNMALGIRGLSGSTSTLNKETIQFLNKMGYCSHSHLSKYLGGTPVNDSLLGVKYVLSDNAVYSNYYENYAFSGLYTAYRNPYALSLAYRVDEALLSFPLGFVESMDDPTESDSKINRAVSAVKNKLNELLDIDETVNSAEYKDDYDSPFERLNAIVTAMLGEDETVQIFVPVTFEISTDNLTREYRVGHYQYAPTNDDKAGTLSYSLTMPEDGELYFYLPSDYQRELDLSLVENDHPIDMGSFGGNETTRITSLGMQNAGDELILNMIADDAFYPMIGQECFYYIDWAVFEDAMARLAQNQYRITEFTEHSFDGTYVAATNRDTVLTTLAFDRGWSVYVDGQKVDIQKALGSLISFEVKGAVGQEHRIEIVYEPSTLRIGLTISLVSLGLLAVLILLEKPLRGVPILRSITSIPTPKRRRATAQGTANQHNILHGKDH